MSILNSLKQRQQSSINSDDSDPSATDTPKKALSRPPHLKPLPPNDFQKFIQETTGQSLPLYGYNFFDQGAYDPPASTPVAPDYRLGPGDQVYVRGWGSVDFDVKTTIDRDGQIHLPRVGAITLAGVRSGEAEGVVRAAVAKYYKDFQLTVTQGRLRGMTIYVVGQARKPGAYTVSGVSTVITALMASGGPNENGSLRRVQVKRGDKVISQIDLYAFLAQGDNLADIKLQDGDTVVIPAAQGYVALSGKVKAPAVYELKAGETIESLLKVSGGLPVMADPKRATLERVDPNATPPRSVDTFALDAQGLKRVLKPGDLLSVAPLLPEFGNAVVLRGNVSQPMRQPWKPGMKVSDLIPGRTFLLSQAAIKRQNDVLLTEDEKLQTQQPFGQDATPGGPGDDTPAMSNYGKLNKDQQPLVNRAKTKVAATRVVTDNEDSLAERIGNLVDEINFEYAVIERVDREKVQVKLIPFNLGQALDNPSGPDNVALQPGDVVTVFSVNDVRVPLAKRQVYVRVEGEVKRPGIYQMKQGDSLQQLVEKAGGLTDDAYLFGAGFYREQVRKDQLANLDQLVRKLEMQTQTQLSSSAASASMNDAAGVAQLRIAAEQAAQKQALDRLRNLKPTGRIMLGLKADNASLSALPQLRLENQDRLVIPSRPDFVYVLGSVNTESSLIWRRGATVQDYLDVSGLTNGADKDQLFVIRADGSVLSNNDRWFSSVARAEVQPGDLIVLPEKTDHESAWSVFTRNAKDITQIVYQFSLGAAAIKTLRQ
ncbi:MAG TPA: SLBB domain-containing protein [Aquabacterium sp.]|nr:SLBB domain-containing protein [Aquabacterium sp.]